MGAIISLAFTVVFLVLFFWSIHSLSVLRLQMDEVLVRLERMERGGQSASSGSI